MSVFTNRKAEVLFETGFHFELEYLSDEEMKYTSLMADNKGKTEVVKTYIKDHENGVYSVSWVEETGTSVTHVINLNKGSVYAFMNWPDGEAYGGRAAMDHEGTFKFIDEKEEKVTNKDIVLAFWEEFFNGKDTSAADRYISENEYLQHNPGGRDGRDGFRDGFNHMFKNDLKDSEFKVMNVLVNDDLVGIHNFVTRFPGDTGFAALDMFRVKDGKIMEHWDVLQEINPEAPNPRGMV